MGWLRKITYKMKNYVQVLVSKDGVPRENLMEPSQIPWRNTRSSAHSFPYGLYALSLAFKVRTGTLYLFWCFYPINPWMIHHFGEIWPMFFALYIQVLNLQTTTAPHLLLKQQNKFILSTMFIHRCMYLYLSK